MGVPCALWPRKAGGKSHTVRHHIKTPQFFFLESLRLYFLIREDLHTEGLLGWFAFWFSGCGCRFVSLCFFPAHPTLITESFSFYLESFYFCSNYSHNFVPSIIIFCRTSTLPGHWRKRGEKQCVHVRWYANFFAKKAGWKELTERSLLLCETQHINK